MAARVEAEFDLPSRVAWTYLATVAAAIVGGLLALIAYQVVNPLACPIVDAEGADLALSCSLAAASGLMLLGFAGAFAGASRLLKLPRPLAAWLGTVAGVFWLVVGLSGIGQWWWLALLVLLPALAALASAPWRPTATFGRIQVGILAVALAAAIAALGWQLLAG